MLIVISPAKTLDFESAPNTSDYSMPDFLEKSEVLVQKLRKLSPNKLQELMNISPKLAELNAERNAQWSKELSPSNAKQALLAFKGDVYLGLEAEGFSEADHQFAQNHLRILSGLYGLLRPLDLIKPYRLEMGTKLPIARKKDLYAFWDIEITKKLNEALSGKEKPILVNLASNEYFKAVQTKKLEAEIITPVFKESKNGQYKVISFFAKKARGQMAAFIIKNRLTKSEDLKGFDTDGYLFNTAMSKGNEWVFTRG